MVEVRICYKHRTPSGVNQNHLIDSIPLLYSDASG